MHVGGGIDRFPEYTAAVERSDRPAFVLVTEETEPPLEVRLEEMDIAFSRERIGPYLVIRPLSRTVHPGEVVEAIDYRY